MTRESEVAGTNANAPFTLLLHRGEGMVLLGMNWRAATPPDDFAGFAIEYREPGGDRFFPLTNRINFPLPDGRVNHKRQSTRLSPIQKFRWVHFPRNADKPGDFRYRVLPVFMNDAGDLSFGDAQEAAVELRQETYPRKLNVAFTRGFVLSQAFVDRFGGDVATLIPDDADGGLTFKPTHPKADEALLWMGFEAREAILAVLDAAIADPQAQVRVVAYELNEPHVLARLEALGGRLKIIIDSSDDHAPEGSAESQAERALVKTAGRDNVKRQRMGNLQHNKTIVVESPKSRAAVCGSTNFSWRGFYVQNNNAVILRTKPAVKHFLDAFEAYWHHNTPPFGGTPSAQFSDLGLSDVTAEVGFSPYTSANSQLKKVADDIEHNAGSSVLYSLAFLWQTPGAIKNAIKAVTADPKIFVYGISDKRVGGLDVQLPGGNVEPVSPQELSKNVPEPFKSEPKALVKGSAGNRMHHKFVVIDFDKPSARVYLGSYNFSKGADDSNGENLMLVRDRRVALSYAVEALRIFDHYQFRVAQLDAKTAKTQLVLARPPRDGTEKPWWHEDYSDARKIRDRELFSGD
jgi:phosphatidylserine/phosphatidylglycerophosphate/cardiolipin synthase-like enzyme